MISFQFITRQSRVINYIHKPKKHDHGLLARNASSPQKRAEPLQILPLTHVYFSPLLSLRAAFFFFSTAACSCLASFSSLEPSSLKTFSRSTGPGICSGSSLREMRVRTILAPTMAVRTKRYTAYQLGVQPRRLTPVGCVSIVY